MTLEVDDEFRFVSIWLTKDEELEKEKYVGEIQDQIDMYRAKKYKFVIYHSGDRDLLQLTSDLLNHNKEIIDEKKYGKDGDTAVGKETMNSNAEKKVQRRGKVR